MRGIVWPLIVGTLFLPIYINAAEVCRQKTNMDAGYCDENRDLIPDAPKNPALLKNPDTLFFMYTPVQDVSVNEKIFDPLTKYLAQCTGKQVAYARYQSDAEELEAMRTGQLHIAAFASGTTVSAVNKSGAVPFASWGKADKAQGYYLLLIVKKDSPYKKPDDLKGKKVAHVSETSNSGHIAPLSLLPRRGLTPGIDYQPLFSGKHDKSILGVKSGEYDAAPVASDVFHRMVAQGQIKEDEFRVLYTSPRFPTSSIAHAYDLQPALRDKIVKCFFDFRSPPQMQKSFDNADRFVPIIYASDWEIIRSVAATNDRIKSAAKKK
ncbi:MAG TPA: phosphate/phosphite/phosphonate ABC transporter substrate-binding protein [Burkholderiales bacterium]|nr:phosphate/phosphite/phosphonate ABC transporter substrate-binding protein [Burkholderiales bacterium]